MAQRHEPEDFFGFENIPESREEDIAQKNRCIQADQQNSDQISSRASASSQEIDQFIEKLTVEKKRKKSIEKGLDDESRRLTVGLEKPTERRVPEAFLGVRFDEENQPQQAPPNHLESGLLAEKIRRSNAIYAPRNSALYDSSEKFDAAISGRKERVNQGRKDVVRTKKPPRYESIFADRNREEFPTNSVLQLSKNVGNKFVESEHNLDENDGLWPASLSVDNYRKDFRGSAPGEKPVAVEANDENLSAYDVVHQMRKEKEENEFRNLAVNDRDGSLIALHKLWSLIPDLSKMTKYEIVSLLLENVIYNENELIAINKPYSLPCIGGAGVKYSVSNYLEDLRQKLAPEAKRLYLAHRIDKMTTGVLMLTTSEKSFFRMKRLFAKRALTKNYWCIVRGVPEPPEGTIDIPLAESEMCGNFKIIPLPHRTKENEEVVPRDIRTRCDAITHYKTLSSNSGCSLVETRIETGVKHQIRSHLGFGLNCPVLGDHKYSHYMKILPQRLAPETLRRLDIRAAKSRHLPLYLHAKEIIIPEFADNKNVFIRAQLPKCFLYTLKKLRIAI